MLNFKFSIESQKLARQVAQKGCFRKVWICVFVKSGFFGAAKAISRFAMHKMGVKTDPQCTKLHKMGVKTDPQRTKLGSKLTLGAQSAQRFSGGRNIRLPKNNSMAGLYERFTGYRKSAMSPIAGKNVTGITFCRSESKQKL
jgi:hypothetical protein